MASEVSPAAILENASRLLADADLLSANGRWPSAHALGLLAIEEVGKVVLARWGHLSRQSRVRNHRRTFHVQKQAAVGHLLMAGAVLRYVAEEGGRVDLQSADALLKAWTALWETKEGRYLFAAEIGRVDRIKQLGFYEDPDTGLGVSAGDIKAEDVALVLAQVREAMSLFDRDGMLEIALGFYQGLEARDAGDEKSRATATQI